MKLLSLEDYEALEWRAAADLSFKGSIIATKRTILKIKNYYKEKFILKLLDEELFAIYGGLVFDPFHFLLKPFNEMILMLLQSGLVDYWLRKNQRAFLQVKQEKSEPVVLTWDHVYVGFYICLVCFAASYACFIAEVLHFKFKLFLSKSLVNRQIFPEILCDETN